MGKAFDLHKHYNLINCYNGAKFDNNNLILSHYGTNTSKKIAELILETVPS